MFFLYRFFLIDHFDCMIKMFCLKDQKNPHWLLSLLLLLVSFTIVLFFFFDGVICVPLSFFFSS